MKKISSLVLALVAAVGIAHAQGKIMQVNLTDGTHVDFATTAVENVTFADKQDWIKVGVGDYNFNNMEFNEATGVTLYQHSEDPTQYKIENWQEGLPFYFQCYDDNSAFVLPEQDTGWTYTYSNYKDVIYVSEAATYVAWVGTMKTNASSYYDPTTDTYYFAVAYYMYTNAEHTQYARWGVTGYNNAPYDTFVVTTRAAAPEKKTERPQIDSAPTAVDSK